MGLTFAMGTSPSRDANVRSRESYFGFGDSGKPARRRLWFDGGVDGVHDLGGMQGFGPVEVEPNEPFFRSEWEGRTFGVAGVAMMALGLNTAMFRHAIERMDPPHYLGSTYFEHWLTAAATLLVEEGVVTREDLEARAETFPLSRPVSGVPVDVEAPRSGGLAFSVGERVRVRDLHFAGHTRCPRYVRNRRGVIVRVDDAAAIPEIEAHRRERVLEPTYSVRFDATELWGNAAEANAVVHVDLYQSYLEPAAEVGP
jgi:nitrile hydratase subunit beta